jgi:hypothetical protein
LVQRAALVPLVPLVQERQALQEFKVLPDRLQVLQELQDRLGHKVKRVKMVLTVYQELEAQQELLALESLVPLALQGQLEPPEQMAFLG